MANAIAGSLGRLLLIVMGTLTTACSTVAFSDGDRVAIEHDFESQLDEARQMALAECRKTGKTKATFLLTTSKNPALPAAMVRKISTFRCE